MARKKTVDPDAAILRGAPGDSVNDEANNEPNDPPPPAGPKMVKVKIGNLEVEVSEEVAAQMNAERDELNRQLREKDAIVQTLSRKPVETPAKPAGEESIDDLIYTDPKRYREMLKEQTKQEMRQEYQRDQYQRQFWETFWNLHPRLKRMEHDVIAESLLSRHLNEIKDLPMREAAAALGRKVEDYVRQLTGPARPEPTQRKPNRTATLEGGPGRSGPVEDSGNDQEEEPSLGDIIKARQNKIRSGASRTTAS